MLFITETDPTTTDTENTMNTLAGLAVESLGSDGS
jgi:hypothetical protein